jgi:hypothetical protein
VFNVNELLLCALPYHATPEFARLLVLLQLKGTPWEWLAPGQQSGAPPPRDIFVRRCVNDHVSGSFLRERLPGALAALPLTHICVSKEANGMLSVGWRAGCHASSTHLSRQRPPC